MRYLLVSDIHGSAPRLRKVLEYFEKEKLDMLLILGDILNYGPRNGVPEGLDAPAIVSMLNPLSDRIIAVRGNCDAEVDQMLLTFPMMGDYAMVVDNGVKIYITHGHNTNETNMPVTGCDIFVYGHTHRQKLEKQGDVVVCNTGSITFPKDSNPPTFATYADGVLNLHTLDGDIINRLEIKK